MTTRQSLREEIIREKQYREDVSEASILYLIKEGQIDEAVAGLIFFTAPDRLSGLVEQVEQMLRASFGEEDQATQVHQLIFAAELVLGLRSALPDWNLCNSARYGDRALDQAYLQKMADKLAALVDDLAGQSPEAEAAVLKSWHAETVARLAAEETPDPEAATRELLGKSLGEALRHLAEAMAASNLRRLAAMRAAGQTPTEWGNDYAAFLKYAMYLGAAFVACNPVEINWAWDADVPRWDQVMNGLIAGQPDADDDTLARLMTSEVVLANMRLLRPVFLLSEGKTGSICLQVNPKKHNDAQAMIGDATANYQYLRRRLNGGVPNVVFKLPATPAGLEACRALTSQGIGVTITVNFALFQHLPFAQAIHTGEAITCCLANMSGRFAYPVRDDLLARLDELAAYGIDETRARQAAAWAGIAVTRKLHQLLVQKGYDTSQVRPLIASARVYKGQHHEELPHPFMDLTEVVGVSLITVFPKIRRPFDALPDPGFDGYRADKPIPAEVLETLAHSEVFKQGYYVADREWLPDEQERFRPERLLTIDDEAGVVAWPPASSTLAEFIRAYDSFVERIREHKAAVIKS